jgi:hypothetical protein
MAILKKPIFGAAHPEIYPREYAAGEECPPDLEDAAREVGALDAEKPAKKALRAAPENKKAD